MDVGRLCLIGYWSVAVGIVSGYVKSCCGVGVGTGSLCVWWRVDVRVTGLCQCVGEQVLV